MLMNAQTVNQWGQCLFYETGGIESIYGFSANEINGILGAVSGKSPGDDGLVVTVKKLDSQKSQNTVITHQYKESLKDDSLSGFQLLPSEKSVEAHKTNKSLNDTIEAHDEIELIKEIDEGLTEFDVERVLKEQDTHDLYCPNCNSCITRRVILRKRKRKIRISSEDAKRNKVETGLTSELDANSSHATNDQGHNVSDVSLDGSLTAATDDYDRDREPEVFRCLSCFSFFIPTGNGFKLFKIFGHKSEKESLQSPQPVSATKKNWLSSIFASRKEERSTEQEGIAPDNLEVHTVHQVDSPNFYHEIQAINRSDHPTTQLAGRTPVHTEEPAGNVIFKPHQDGLKILVHSSAESFTIEKSQMDPKLNVAIEKRSADDKDSKIPIPVPVLGDSDINEKVNIVRDVPPVNGQHVGATLATRSIVEANDMEITISGNEAAYSSASSQHAIIGTKVNIHMEEPKDGFSLSVQDDLLLQGRQVNITKGLKDLAAKSSAEAAYSSTSSQHAIIDTKMDIHMGEPKDAFSLSIQDDLLLQGRQVNITKGPKDLAAESSAVASKDTIITVKEGPVELAASQEEQAVIMSAETRPSTRTESAEAGGSRGLDIIKSMVYGGLIESITSLGIVSSAAGADAATLNILALGLANLIGGLFFIGHNLWELKTEHSGGASNQVTEGAADRYQELLGQRRNFLLHATVVVLSFLIFGLLPPVIYGFSFRESDNQDYKLITVAAASLLCIIILAIAKAYVQRPPKAYMKTVMYYVVMGFMASGISYAVGDLIEKLLEKLGWFNSSVVLTLPVLETIPVQPGWGSY